MNHLKYNPWKWGIESMRFYTSYFANIRNLNPEEIIPIAISRSIPKWYEGLVYKKLAPSYSILNEYRLYHDTKLYTERYRKEILAWLDISSVILDIETLTRFENKDICFICYETPEKFCHRHIFSEWVNSNSNILCSEFITKSI